MYNRIAEQFFTTEYGKQYYSNIASLSMDTVSARLDFFIEAFGDKAVFRMIVDVLDDWTKSAPLDESFVFASKHKNCPAIVAFVACLQKRYARKTAPSRTKYGYSYVIVQKAKSTQKPRPVAIKPPVPKVEKPIDKSPVCQHICETPDFASLVQYIDIGIPLIPVGTYQKDGKERIYQIKDGDAVVQIKDAGTLKFYIDKGIKRFLFHPADADLLCIDIDKHSGGGDGFASLDKFLKDNYIPRRFVETPVYVDSPNGRHLYFKAERIITDYFRDSIADGVELKKGKSTLTAGGSVKDGNKCYVLHGDLRHIPYEDQRLDVYFRKESKKDAFMLPKYFNNPVNSSADAERIASNFERKHAGEVSHDYIIELAFCMAKNGIPKSECEQWALASSAHNSRREKGDTLKEVADIYRRCGGSP